MRPSEGGAPAADPPDGLPPGPVLCGIADAQAVGLARLAAAHADRLGRRLVLVHVGESPYVPDRPFATRQERALEAEEAARAATLRTVLDPISVLGPPVARTAAFGDPVAAMRRLAQGHSAALVVVGRRRLGAFDRIVFGSTSSGLAREAPCPVLIAPHPTGEVELGSRPAIVCGLDSSDAAAGVAGVAAALARGLDARLVLAHVDERGAGDATPSIAVQAAAAVLDETRIEVEPRRGAAAEQLLACGREHDAALLAVGSRGHGALQTAIVGSVSTRLIELADRPVAIVSAAALRAGGPAPTPGEE